MAPPVTLLRIPFFCWGSADLVAMVAALTVVHDPGMLAPGGQECIKISPVGADRLPLNSQGADCAKIDGMLHCGVASDDDGSSGGGLPSTAITQIDHGGFSAALSLSPSKIGYEF
jgi:hypothetical protein